MIANCIFDEDRNIIDVVFEDGKQTRILCSPIEDAIETSLIGESRMIWLKNNDLEDYAEMILTERLQGYIDLYTRNYLKQQQRLEERIAKKTGNAAYAEAIARELMMYES